MKVKLLWLNQAPILGLLIGTITGIVGVGGGFLLVPTLHYSLNLPMNQAIKSSLIVIALQSLSGFTGYATSISLNYPLVLSFTAYVLVGMILASLLANKLNNQSLKKLFAILLLLVGFFMLWNAWRA